MRCYTKSIPKGKQPQDVKSLVCLVLCVPKRNVSTVLQSSIRTSLTKFFDEDAEAVREKGLEEQREDYESAYVFFPSVAFSALARS